MSGGGLVSLFSQRLLLKLGSRTYQYYESGEREPTLSTLIRMADFYGVSIDYLAGRTDTP